MSIENRPEVHVKMELDARNAAGVWANFAMVSHSKYEFTIDFARLDFPRQDRENNEIPATVVSRVNLSPLLISELMEALSSNWSQYVEKSMPKEVRDNGN